MRQNLRQADAALVTLRDDLLENFYCFPSNVKILVGQALRDSADRLLVGFACKLA